MEKNPIVSLLVPTRERVKYLKRFLKSLDKNTKKPKRVEVLIAYDEDDKKTQRFFDKNKVNARVFKRKRSDSISDGYINWLAAKSRGKYLFVISDDCQIVTKDWDEVLAKVEYKDRMYLITKNNHLSITGFADFPIITRWVYKRIGQVYSKYTPGFSADKHLRNLFLKEDVLEVDITIFHDNYHAGTRKMDHISERIGYLHTKVDEVEKEEAILREKLYGND